MEQVVEQAKLEVDQADAALNMMQAAVKELTNPSPCGVLSSPRTPQGDEMLFDCTPRTRGILDMPVSPPDRMETLSIFGAERIRTLAQVNISTSTPSRSDLFSGAEKDGSGSRCN